MYTSPGARNIFVFRDAIPEDPKDREAIKEVMKELCKNQKCEVLDMIDFICQYYMKVSVLNDLDALEDYEKWKDFLRRVFDY